MNILSLAEKGRNGLWHYVLSILTILFLWMGIGSIPYLLYFIHYQQKGIPIIEWEFFTTMISFVFLFLAIFLAVRVIHQRSFTTLITPATHVSWKKYLYAFFITTIVLYLNTYIDYLIQPNSYQYVFNQWDLNRVFLMLLFGIILIPLQTAAEELLFRGYLLQGLGLKLKSPYVLSTIVSVFFAFFHSANPEIGKGMFPMMLYYFLFSFVLTLLTIKSNRLEYAMGIHCANNMSVLFINYSDSALPSLPVFVNYLWEPWTNLLYLGITLIPIYFLILTHTRKKQT